MARAPGAASPPLNANTCIKTKDSYYYPNTMNPQSSIAPSTIPSSIPTNPVKLISFDIGIKHLAYCILEYSPKATDQYRILEWKVINLLQTDEEKGEKSHPPLFAKLSSNPLPKNIPQKSVPKNPSSRLPPLPPKWP